MKDAASAVLAHEKSTSLAELFSVELKFTINTLNDWFSRIIKPKFLKENPIVDSKTRCSICSFLLEVEEADWFDFVVKCEHLFLRNICSLEDLKKMDIESEEKYTEIVHRLLEFYPLF